MKKNMLEKIEDFEREAILAIIALATIFLPIGLFGDLKNFEKFLFGDYKSSVTFWVSLLIVIYLFRFFFLIGKYFYKGIGAPYGEDMYDGTN